MLKGDTFSFALDHKKFHEEAEARAGNLKRNFVLASLFLAQSAGWYKGPGQQITSLVSHTHTHTIDVIVDVRMTLCVIKAN